jgi:uncharacterized membrane protein YfcA
MITLDVLLFAALVLLIAGTIKGFVGLGLPTVSMALLSLVYEPRAAMSLILLPMLLSNVWQMYRGEDMLGVIGRYWRFGAVLAVTVAATVWFSQSARDEVLLFALGLVVLAFVALSWTDRVPDIPEVWHRPAEVFFASVAGIVGGLTAAWAAPMAIYLKTRRVSPDEFVQASGFLITAGSLPLIVMFLAVSHVEAKALGLSAVLIVPTLLGFSLGEWLRRGIDPKAFHRALMIVFLCLGLNLIFRAL